MKTFIIKVLFGGLGDHLFCSPLPRIAKEHCGFDRVFISNRSEYRHPDYKRMIWELNPFVDGFTDEDAATALCQRGAREGCNQLDEIMLELGLDDGKRFHEPEIFWKAEPCPEVAGKVVYDPNFVSNVGHFESAHVERFLRRRGIKVDVMLQPRGKGVPIKSAGRQYTTRDFQDYCGVISSAKKFICLTSGGATLAAALGVPVIALWGPGQPEIFHHSKLHEYVNVNPTPASRHVYQWLRRSGGRALRTVGVKR